MASTEATSEPATLTSTPAAGQIVKHEQKEYETVKEGLAHILIPRSASSKQQQKKGNAPAQSVFYNPIQQFNRDLSVLAIRAYGEHAITLKTKKWKQRQARRGEGNAPGKKGKKRKREEVAAEKGQAVEGGDEGGENDQPAKKQRGEGGVSSETKVPAPAETEEHAAEAKEHHKGPPFSILDALSASGLRALRYAKEIPFATHIVANDLSASAIEAMQRNIKHNGVDDVVLPHEGDACSYMYEAIQGPQKQTIKQGTALGKFDVIDLDPYGTAAPFMDAAVQAIADGGLLCVTCTDAGVFASNSYPEKAYALYGGTPLKGLHSHEGGLRIILNALASSAARYGMAIEPLLSLSIDFYVRVFVRVHRSPAQVKFLLGKTMTVYNCDHGCGAWKTQLLGSHRERISKDGSKYYHYAYAQAPTTTPNCEHCGSKMHLAGPMWGGPLHNPHFIQKILNLLPGADRETYPTVDRIEGMLSTALEEDLTIDASSREPTPQPENATEANDSSLLIPRTDPAVIEPYPFFFMPSFVCKVLHTETISESALRGALSHLGYRSSRSHAKPGSVRTNAPWEVIWEILREWVRQKSPIKEGAIKPGTPGAGIMQKGREKLDGKDVDDSKGAGLRALKRDLLAAVENGNDISDLTTKIEAALYRAGSRRQQGEEEKLQQEAAPTPEAPAVENGENGLNKQAANTATPEKPDPSTLTVVFDEALGKTALASQRKKRLTRYQVNPRPNWGPMNRAAAGTR
ncbi:N2,N2-dimethylguanosine tRNA methyltransferase [Polytolypa hystricis UAMH7299]|uniref:tRNA (guanine(26)-N(2))-dimethyltransferase n=1 Tax=Polytolypa hystricis (strain UAMH7299) TaxID=1447883 RepID=A0A2B7YFZ0_POLH7|nr:N2,N2-dimethylguanosine tRNA methyltransferase [Polytolypa hystricis UAMH7299]